MNKVRIADLTPAQRADAELGIVWWNGLTERERREWMERAGDTGVAADAWAAFKRADQPGEKHD